MEIINDLDFWIQIFLLIVVVFYTIFAFLVYKQVGILNDTISTPRAALLRKFAFSHLISTILVLVGLILVLLL
jgi:hypothetical protein